MSKKKSITEAAQDILAANLSQKGLGEPFGVSKGNLPTQTQDLGGPQTRTIDQGSPFNASAPIQQATPPGATPPVSAEPMKTLATQPQQVLGRQDLAQSPEDINTQDYQEIADRIAGKRPNQTFGVNPNATPLSSATPGQDPVSVGYNESVTPEQKEKMKEDIDAMFSGETLSEEFKEKATIIFEAAVNARVTDIANILESKLVEEFNEAVDSIKEEFSTKIDDYLNYVVEEWMKENEIAIEKGLKSEITEDFMKSLHNVFMEHYIDIPEEKVDLVGELSQKVESLEESLNNEMTKNIELKKLIAEHKKEEIIHTVCEGLTLTQQEKLKTLISGVDYNSDEEFISKVNVIKESYFQKPSTKTTLVEDFDTSVDSNEEKSTAYVDPTISAYVKTISKMKK